MERETTAPDRPATQRGRWALAAVLLLALGAFYLSGLHRHLSWDYFRAHFDLFQAEARQHLILALLLFFLAYVAATGLSLPIATPLSLLGGALFGRWLGSATVAVAATLGATLAFLSSRYLLRDFVQGRFGDRLAPLNRGVERDGGYYLFSLRLVPAFPFFLINLGMGLTPVRTWTFFWVSLLGMLPGTFLYVNAGTALAAIDDPRDVLSPTVLVSLALLGLAPLAFRLLVRRKARR
jgi:uncharacterized membrane protein YdjX (TVP38/TMEM64 family)